MRTGHRAAMTLVLGLGLMPGVGLLGQTSVGWPTGSVSGSAFAQRAKTELGPTYISTARETGRVDIGGTLFGPRFLTFRLGVAQTFGQKNSSFSTSDTGLSSDGLDGLLNLSFFPGFTVQGGLVAQRMRRHETNLYGGLDDVLRDSWRVTGLDRNPLLPVRLSFEDRTETRTLQSRVASAPIPWARSFRRFEYVAHNWKTQLRVFQVRGEEQILDLPREYFRREASARNLQRWGKGSSLSNRVQYRRNIAPTESTGWSYQGTVQLQQTGALSTNALFSARRTRSDGFASSGRVVRVGMRFSPRRGLRGSLRYTHGLTAFGGGSTTQSSVRPDFSFTRSLPKELVLNANIGGTYKQLNRVVGGELFVHVVDEVHTVDSEYRFGLPNPFVDASSVLIEQERGGTLLIEGLDYSVVEEGPYLVVLALPGGRLEDGANVRVSYRYQVPPEVASGVLEVRGGLTLRWRQAEVFYRRDVRDQFHELESPFGVTVQDVDRQMFGVSVQGTLGSVSLSTRGQEERTTAPEFEIVRHVVNTSASALLGRFTNVSLGGNWVRTSIDPGDSRLRVVSLTNFRGSASRPLSGTVTVGAHFAVHSMRETGRQQGFLRFGANANYSGGGTNVNLRVDRVTWHGASGQGQTTVSLNFSRAFSR